MVSAAIAVRPHQNCLRHVLRRFTGIFVKLLPFAQAHNVRIVLVNRRDYLGSAPYSDDELSVLKAAHSALPGNSDAARTALLGFMRDRAREVYDLLVKFVADNDVPLASHADNTGGIIVSGWSFGSGLMIALLAYVAEFPVSGVELGKYVRRVVFYGVYYAIQHSAAHSENLMCTPLDGPMHTMGYSPPEDPYNPLWDPAVADDRPRAFANWVSGYFQHGDTADAIERRVALANPPPTLSTLTEEELASVMYPGPGNPGGSDDMLMGGGIQSGMFKQLKDKAFYLQPGAKAETLEEDPVTDAWRDVEVRYVWCERSVWEMTWSAWKIREELQEAKESGKKMRNLKVLRLPGANHFVSLRRLFHSDLAIPPC